MKPGASSWRVVMDTNLVLSALVLAQGRLTDLRHAWQDGRIEPLVSRATAAELIRALGYPRFRLTAAQQRELLADYLPHCVTVRMPEPMPQVPACRDVFDLPLLQLAVAGKAEAVVTGNRDLLALAPTFACPVMSAEHFLAQLVMR